jgi:hypothetical protein
MHTPHPTANAAHCVLAAGERLPQARLRVAWETHEVQQVLQAARQRFGHALCTCRREPLKLQIRLREGKYHLAVWPQEGPVHDSVCAFFRDEVAEQASPVANLRLASAAEQPTPVATPAAGRARLALVLGGTAEPAPKDTVVSVRALSHRLWESASLCRWHPDWTRDWGRARYQLLQAASEFTLNGRPAEDLLFAPRPYREARQDALNAEWDAFVRQLVTTRDGGPRLLVAPVRRLSAPREGHAASAFLRHLHAPIGLTPACYDFLARECRHVLRNNRLAQPSAPEDLAAAPEVVGLFSVEGSSRGGVWARAGWLLSVHPSTYIPAATRDLALLVDALVRGRYAFQYLINELAPSRRTTADWLVRHVLGPDGRPVARAALEVVSRTASAEFLALRATIAQHMSEQGIPTWSWSPPARGVDRAMPPLPPTDLLPTDAAQEQLKQIAASPDVDYRFEARPQPIRDQAVGTVLAQPGHVEKVVATSRRYLTPEL